MLSGLHVIIFIQTELMVRQYCTWVCRPLTRRREIRRGEGGVWERPGVERKGGKDVIVRWKMMRKRARLKCLQRSKATTFPQNSCLKLQTDRQKLCYFSDQNLTNWVGQLFCSPNFSILSYRRWDKGVGRKSGRPRWRRERHVQAKLVFQCVLGGL